MSRFHFTRVSSNAKTGPIPVVTASKDTCPTDCPLMGDGCYADYGPLGLFWRKVSTKGALTFDKLLEHIRALPKGTLWRYAQAGDLPNDDADVIRLARASVGRPVIAYTHKRNFELLRHLRTFGMHVNLSASDLQEADDLAATGLPVTVVLPSHMGRAKHETLREYRDRLDGRLRFHTEAGNWVAICPATYLDKTNCASCQACVKPRAGGTIIGFPAHGSGKGRIDRRLTVGPTKERDNDSHVQFGGASVCRCWLTSAKT